MPSGLVTIQTYHNIVLATITKDRLTDPTSIAGVAADLDYELQKHPKISLVLDCSRITAMSSQMLGKLVALYKQVKAGKGRMCLCGLAKDLMPLFTVTKLHKLFDFEQDAQQVILLYQRKPL